MFNAPTPVMALAGILAGIWLLLALAPNRMVGEVLLNFAVFGAREAEFSLWSFGRFITYQFLHRDLVHMLINAMFLIAFGTPVMLRLGLGRFLAFYLLCGIAGAVIYTLLNQDSTVPMIGASGAISGLLGGVLHFGFGSGPAAQHRVRSFVMIWVGMNLVLALVGPLLFGNGGGLAWQAHLGGFVAGWLLFVAFDRPGGWRPKGPKRKRPKHLNLVE